MSNVGCTRTFATHRQFNYVLRAQCGYGNAIRSFVLTKTKVVHAATKFGRNIGEKSHILEEKKSYTIKTIISKFLYLTLGRLLTQLFTISVA